jgi:hypothetical protein
MTYLVETFHGALVAPYPNRGRTFRPVGFRGLSETSEAAKFSKREAVRGVRHSLLLQLQAVRSEMSRVPSKALRESLRKKQRKTRMKQRINQLGRAPQRDEGD